MEDREAFREFYLANFTQLVHLIKRLQNGRTEKTDILAEDIAQDCFCLALAEWQMLRQHPNPQGWLVKTAKNLLCNQIRKRENQTMSYEQQVVDARKGVVDCELESVDIMLFLEELLPNVDLKILCQYYISGYSLTEIACMFGMNENTARVKLMRIRKKVRRNWT